MAGIKGRLRKIGVLAQMVYAARTARFRARRWRHRAHIHEYLRTHSVRKLQLGTGSNVLDGWLNTDIYDDRRNGEVVYLDARKRFPLPDASFDLVYSEHMIEHIPYRDAQRGLRECRRVVRPGGRDLREGHRRPASRRRRQQLLSQLGPSVHLRSPDASARSRGRRLY